MPRRLARSLITRRSPGRNRMVIRSVERSRREAAFVSETSLQSSKERMAIRASVDSDIPRLAANVAKRSFSAGVGRAVIDGRREAEPLLLTMETPFVQQKADASLSCHQIYSSPHAPTYRSDLCGFESVRTGMRNAQGEWIDNRIQANAAACRNAKAPGYPCPTCGRPIACCE